MTASARSARSAHKCSLIIGFYNSLPNSWFKMFSFLIQPSEVDLSGVAKISDSKLLDHAKGVEFL